MANKSNSSLPAKIGSQPTGSSTIRQSDTSPNARQTQYVTPRFVQHISNESNYIIQGLTFPYALESLQILVLTTTHFGPLRIRQCSIGTFAKLDGLSYLLHMRYWLKATSKEESWNREAYLLMSTQWIWPMVCVHVGPVWSRNLLFITRNTGICQNTRELSDVGTCYLIALICLGFV